MFSLFGTRERHEPAIGLLVIILLFLAIGTFTINGLFTLGKLTRTIYEHPLVVSNAALNAALGITKMHRDMKDVVLSSTLSEIEVNLDRVAGNERSVYKQLEVIRVYILGTEGQALQRQAQKLFDEWKPIRHEVVRLYSAGEQEKAIRITREKGARHVAKLEAKMLELTAYARAKSTQFIQSAESNQARLEGITISLTILGVILSALIAVFTLRRVGREEARLLDNNQDLQQALAEIKTLRGILPICSYCHQIRDDEGIWNQIELYLRDHSEADFSHAICPGCMKEKFPAQYQNIQRRAAAGKNSDAP